MFDLVACELMATSIGLYVCVALVVCTTYFLAMKPGYTRHPLTLRSGSLTVFMASEEKKPSLTQKHIDAIASRRWKEVLVWLVFHHDELLWLDKRKQTALHHACLFRAPAEVIAMILYQAPELARMANMDDEIPLHWAVRLSAPNEVIQSLLSAYPISGCSVRDKDGDTALSLVWDRHEEDLMSLWWDVGREGIIAHAGWKGILYFLQCFSFSFSTRAGDIDCCDAIELNGRSFLPLHAVTLCSLCPVSMFPLFLQVYKDHVMEQDNLGRTPLAIACLDPVSNRSVGAMTKVHLLLAENAEAGCIPDHSGRIPVLNALESGVRWEEGIDQLIAICPHSLQVIDPVTALPPFLLAATAPKERQRDDSGRARSSVHGYDVEAKCLSTIFSMLRTDPAQLTFLL